MNDRVVVMLGTGLDAPGGITTVARNLRDGGLFRRFGIRYLATYESRSPINQLTAISRALVELLWLIACRRVALVHVHSASRGSFWRKSFFCAVAAAFRIPYVFHLHSGEFPAFFSDVCGPAAQRWVRYILRRAAAVICLTKTWHAFINEIEPLARATVIGNPVPVPGRLTPLRDPPRSVLFLGRLREKKGVFDLISAMPIVLAVCPQLRFILAGDEDAEWVLAEAKALGVAHALELPGWIGGERKRAYLTQADIFVLPTHFEALGMANLEAMAMGIPVVSTNVGGIPDVIDHDISGILVSPGNTEALAAALIALGSNKELRERLRCAAFEKVDKLFSTPTIVESFAALYRSIGIR